MGDENEAGVGQGRAFEHIVVCVDDTDDVTKATSTGAVAERIAGQAVGLGATLNLGVTRHQLLLSDEIAYTSHNSAMAFSAYLPADAVGLLGDFARETVAAMMASTADPGLCIARVPMGEGDGSLRRVIEFGQAAKERVIAKAEALALALADEVSWLRLWELGGTGEGAIGALAGVGLRLSGNDGRFRGRVDLGALCGSGARPWHASGRGDGSGGGRHRGHGDGSGSRHGGRRDRRPAASQVEAADLRRLPSRMSLIEVRQVRERLGDESHGRVDVVDPSGTPLPDGMMLMCDEPVKPVLFAGQMAIVARGEGDVARPCAKASLDELTGSFSSSRRSCEAFELDNDLEELAADPSLRVCPNCLFRRWTPSGFTCMRPVMDVNSTVRVLGARA